MTGRTTVRRAVAALACGVLATAAIGCARLGPGTLRVGRGNYNEAIQKTNVEQMLLNIVRLRYIDQPYFLQIASVTSQPKAGASFGGNESRGASGLLAYSEEPAIIYTPLAGESFVRRLLTHVDLQTIFLLVSAGWEIDDMLRIFTNQINDLPNAPTLAGPTPEAAPEFEKFLAAVETFDQLADSGDLLVAPREDLESEELVLYVTERGRRSARFQDFARLLELDPALDSYRLRIGVERDAPNEVVFVTRPIMAAMFYLSHAVEVPQDARDSGAVHLNLDENGEPFDVRAVFDGLFRVRASQFEPQRSYAKVEYEGTWYYIDLGDTDSKETLTLLMAVFTLQAGGIPRGGPVLTLPVTGR